VALFAPAAPVQAAAITFSFAGDVDQVNDPDGVLTGLISESSSFSGTYTFNSEAADVLGSQFLGNYFSVNAPYGWSVQVGTLSSSGTSVQIRIDNESPQDIYDVFLLVPTLPSGIDSLQLTMRLLDDTDSAFSNDDLPLTPPDLADFDFQRQFDIIGTAPGEASFTVIGTVTMLVPEPSTALLLSGGLAVLSMLGRRRRAPSS
jgi:hypothetical protein